MVYCDVSADPPFIMSVSFFHEKYLLAVADNTIVILAHLHCVQGKHLMKNEQIGTVY